MLRKDETVLPPAGAIGTIATGAAISGFSGGALDYAPDTLLGSFKSEAAARDAAELYGITLESYNGSLAVFKCEGDPKALVDKGRENGWPELSLNYIVRSRS